MLYWQKNQQQQQQSFFVIIWNAKIAHLEKVKSINECMCTSNLLDYCNIMSMACASCIYLVILAQSNSIITNILRLGTLQWPPLQDRRNVLRLTHLYKAVNNISPIEIPDYVIPSSGRKRRHDLAYFQLRTNYEHYKNSFLPKSTREWNALPRTLCTPYL